MFGVVLWCDSRESKAVIWCEDHGDLAFYRRSERSEPLAMDAGDWVQFDVTVGSDMRYAHNPRLVAEGAFDGLADNLIKTGAQGEPALRPAPRSAQILPFGPVRSRREAQRAGAAWA